VYPDRRTFPFGDGFLEFSFALRPTPRMLSLQKLVVIFSLMIAGTSLLEEFWFLHLVRVRHLSLRLVT